MRVSLSLFSLLSSLLLPTMSIQIAPVGLAFRNATDEELYAAVQWAIISSHVHPEAIDGAWLQAHFSPTSYPSPSSFFIAYSFSLPSLSHALSPSPRQKQSPFCSKQLQISLPPCNSCKRYEICQKPRLCVIRLCVCWSILQGPSAWTIVYL